MVVLSCIHYLYLAGIMTILIFLITGKNVVLPSLLFTFLIGLVSSSSLLEGIFAVHNSIIYAGREYFSLISTMSIVMALSKVLKSLKADTIFLYPITKIIRTPTSAFFGLGTIMALLSILVWPSPSVILVGAFLLPIALRAGLSSVGAAVALNIFGHGFAMSLDPLLQGAPGITSSAAGISPFDILKYGFPLFMITGLVAIVLSYIQLRPQFVNSDKNLAQGCPLEPPRNNKKAKLMFFITLLAFVLMIFCLIFLKLYGSSATSLISVGSIFLIIIGSIIESGVKESFGKISEYLKEGFAFSMSIFTPIIIIGGFFLIGGAGAPAILGPQIQEGLLVDWVLWAIDHFNFTRFTVAALMLLLGCMTGLSGSGFTGLPLIGSIAGSFGNALGLNTAILASLGQIGSTWVGGGTLVPWKAIQVAAICDVDEYKLTRTNFKPVLIGLLASLLLSFLLL